MSKRDHRSTMRSMIEADVASAKEDARDYLRKAEAALEACDYVAAASAARGVAACADHCAHFTAQDTRGMKA